jgi:hypothetical protein
MTNFTIVRTGAGEVQLVDKATGRSETVSFASPAGKKAEAGKTGPVADVPDIPSYRVWALGA